MRGSVESLTSFVNANTTLELDGNIVTKEFVEGTVPEAIQKAFFDKSLSYDDQIASYIKRAGTDGPELKVGGKRILRFSMWDQAGTDVHITVSHDNVAEIAAFNEVKQKETASLPDGNE